MFLYLRRAVTIRLATTAGSVIERMIHVNPGLTSGLLSRPGGTRKAWSNLDYSGLLWAELTQRIQMFSCLCGFRTIGIAPDYFAPGGAVVVELLRHAVEFESHAF